MSDQSPPLDSAAVFASYLPPPREPVPPGTEAAAAMIRTAQWDSSIRPVNVLECWLAEQISWCTLRIERCQLQETALRGRNAKRAKLRWDEDRRLEAEILAGGLHEDPAVVARRLRRFPAGCDLMIDRWRMLAESARRTGSVNDSQRMLVLNLLGTAPELRGSHPDLPLSPRPEVVIRLAEQQIAELERAKEAGREEEADLRKHAEMGLLPDDGPEGRVLRREEAACRRFLLWAIRQIRSEQHRGIPRRPKAEPTASRAAESPRPTPPPQSAPVAPAPSSSWRTESPLWPEKGVEMIDVAITPPPDRRARRKNWKNAFGSR